MLRKFRAQGPSAAIVARLYEAIVERARAPVFYRDFLVADSIDGRFDLLALHAFLVMEPLKHQGKAGAELGEALATAIFAGFDEALRELGVGDFGLSRRIKAMANAFYGRLEAYEGAASEAALAAAIERNIYRGEAGRDAKALTLARYATAARERLASPSADAALLSGAVDFGQVPQ